MSGSIETETRNCLRCGKEYVTIATYKPVPKCATCDDTEYILMKDVFEYCSHECRIKYDKTGIRSILRVLKDNKGGRKNG